MSWLALTAAGSDWTYWLIMITFLLAVCALEFAMIWLVFSPRKRKDTWVEYQPTVSSQTRDPNAGTYRRVVLKGD